MANLGRWLPAFVMFGACTTTPTIITDTMGSPPGHALECEKRIDQGLDSIRTVLAMEDCIRRLEVPTKIARESRRLMDAGWTIPEAHDEQRLLIDGSHYGPMTFVFASPYAGQFEHNWQVAEHGTAGMLAALVYVDTSYFDDDGEPVKLGGQYAGLRLGPGLNCVWLSLTGGNWKASISHPSKPGMACDVSETGAALNVARSANLDPSNYPAVARFTEKQTVDGEPGDPLLGFRCVGGWCDVGVASAGAGLLVRQSASNIGGREGRVSGWHDEQLLSEWVDGRLRRTKVRATIVPVPGLPQPSRVYDNRWVQVGTLVISGSGLQNTRYAAWGLQTGANKLWLRQENGKWLMKVARSESAAGMPWGAVEHHVHRDAPVPGTARFRFNSYDDGVWVPCGDACCYSKGGSEQ